MRRIRAVFCFNYMIDASFERQTGNLFFSLFSFLPVVVLFPIALLSSLDTRLAPLSDPKGADNTSFASGAPSALTPIIVVQDADSASCQETLLALIDLPMESHAYGCNLPHHEGSRLCFHCKTFLSPSGVSLLSFGGLIRFPTPILETQQHFSGLQIIRFGFFMLPRADTNLVEDVAGSLRTILSPLFILLVAFPLSGFEVINLNRRGSGFGEKSMGRRSLSGVSYGTANCGDTLEAYSGVETGILGTSALTFYLRLSKIMSSFSPSEMSEIVKIA
eukprot:IDg6426t1